MFEYLLTDIPALSGFHNVTLDLTLPNCAPIFPKPFLLGPSHTGVSKLVPAIDQNMKILSFTTLVSLLAGKNVPIASIFVICKYSNSN